MANISTALKCFYATLEGEGVKDNEILFGSKVRLVFHIPKLSFSDESVHLGFTIMPFGLQFPERNPTLWHQDLNIPCEESEVVFSFIVPTEKKWKKDITPGFSFTFDVNGLSVFSQFLKVRFVSSFNDRKRREKFAFHFIDLEKGIESSVKQIRKFEEQEKNWQKEFAWEK